MLACMEGGGDIWSLLAGVKTGVATTEISVKFPQRARNRLSYGPAIPLVLAGLCQLDVQTRVI